MLIPRNHPARRRLHAARHGKLLAVMLLAGLCAGAAHAQTVSIGRPLGGGFFAPVGVAVDGGGNVYVGDSHNNAVKEIPAGCTSASCVVTLVSGLSDPFGVAVDSSGNVYVAEDLGTVKEIPSGCTSFTCVISLGGGFSGPQDVAVDGSGNIYVASGGTVSKIPPGCTSSSCVTTLGGGWLLPEGVALDAGGDVYVTDASLNGVFEMPAGCSSASCVTRLAGSFLYPEGVTVDTAGNVYVSDGNNNAVKEIPAGCASADCVTPLAGAFSGPTGVALDSGGNLYVANFVSNVVEELVPEPTSFGSVAVNAAAPATQTFSFTFTASGTVAAPAVLTQGAKNLDFTDAGTGTCTTNGPSHTYNIGDTCTVVVNFIPRYAGTRNGAVVLANASNARIATQYIFGTGTGPQIVFGTGTLTRMGGEFAGPEGIAVDAAGNLYVVDDAGNSVYEMPPNCASSACRYRIGGGFQRPLFTAVDGAGNVYVADGPQKALKKIPAGCFSSTCVTTVGGGFGLPVGVAVDGNGSIYVTDPYYGSLDEMPPGCGSSSCVTKLVFGFDDPVGVAVDGNGNAYVADALAYSIKELPIGCHSSSCEITLFQDYPALSPNGLAMDGTGNLYFTAETSGSNFAVVEELPLGCASPDCAMSLATSSVPIGPGGVAVDERGNVDFTLDSVYKLDLADAPALTFPTTAGGQSSAPQTVSVQNIGNQPVTFPIPSSGNNPGISGNFTLDSSGENACPLVGSGSDSAGMLAADSSCTLDISFTPSSGSSGPMFGSLALTDDTLNAPAPAYATQTLLLSEPGTTRLVGSLDGVVDATTRSTTVAQADNLRISGWAADVPYTFPVSSVAVLIDGLPVGNATLGFARPDLVAAYNNVSYYNSGWSFTYPAAGLAIGSHTAAAVAYDSLGLSTQLQTRTFTVAATPSWGPPFGSLEGAVDATTRSSTVAQSDNLLVSGWAADPHDGAPVSSVSILIDGTAVGTATLGIARPDVVASQKNSAYLHSGWTFTYAASGLSLGTHTVTAVATDSLGNSKTFVSKTITVATAPIDGPPFGSLDKAVDATTGLTTVSQADNLFVSGWAADVHDGAPVHQVSILIDGTAVGNATLGFARLDVANKKGSAYTNSGWRFTMSASSLSAGTHTVTAVATDSLGLSTQFEIRAITVTP